MNITDVDDKIILAARQQHLLADWLSKHTQVDQEIRDTALQAFRAYIEKNLPLFTVRDTTPQTYVQNADTTYGHVLRGESIGKDGSPPGDREAKMKMHLKTSHSAADALQMDKPGLDAFAAKASGVLLPYIDSLHSTSVSGDDHDVFTKLTKKYEGRFFEDMKMLNVKYPDEVTRVTEYGPPIVDFVKQIQENGFAYEHEGSVYYDTGKWESSGGVYARLEPWNRHDKDLQADGEGSLSTNKTSFKRSGADFALWKASKPGEPSWSSPWGQGRPGWHIECSAMASKILGKTIDIHSGGIDLAFPHHDNELAQSEAYWSQPDQVDKGEQWVNYFLHMGHLSIQGSKMSKSLKNFTTIREALTTGQWTPRSLRIVFLLGAWRDGLEITDELVKASTAWEERVNNFFLKVRDLQNERTPNETSAALATHAATPNGSGNDLGRSFENTKHRFHEALCDSFDTPTAMRAVSDLLTAYNSAKDAPKTTSQAIGQWVTDTVVMLGLDAAYQPSQLGWSGIDIPEEAKPSIYPLASLRDKVREQAIAGEVDLNSLGKLPDLDTTYGNDQPYASAYADFQRKVKDLNSGKVPSKEWLAACDHVRDVVLWNLNIYLEDRENRPALVRPLSASLRQDRQDREALAASKAAAKQKVKSDAEAAEKQRLEKGKLSHLEMFRTSEYTEWDADGLPTTDAEGKEIAKSRSKKLRKDWERQKKAHEAYLAVSNGS